MWLFSFVFQRSFPCFIALQVSIWSLLLTPAHPRCPAWSLFALQWQNASDLQETEFSLDGDADFSIQTLAEGLHQQRQSCWTTFLQREGHTLPRTMVQRSQPGWTFHENTEYTQTEPSTTLIRESGMCKGILSLLNHRYPPKAWISSFSSDGICQWTCSIQKATEGEKQTNRSSLSTTLKYSKKVLFFLQVNPY